MIVHGSSMSHFVRKVLVFAGEKGIAVENRPRRLGQDEPGWRDISPFAKIPAIEDGDFKLSDSTAIVAYIEAKHAEPALIPSDPQAKGRVFWFDELADTILFPAYAKVFFNRVVAPMIGMAGDLAEADRALAEDVPPILDYLETQISDGFLVGDTLTLADIAVASPFANAEMSDAPVDAAHYPATAAFVQRTLGRPSFAPWLEADRKTLRS